MNTADFSVIKAALLTVTDKVYHYQSHAQEDNYIVWAEDSAYGDLRANNSTEQQTIGGTVDLYTRTPEDGALFDAVQEALDGVCCWRLNSIQFEEDTGYTHYEWRWEVA